MAVGIYRILILSQNGETRRQFQVRSRTLVLFSCFLALLVASYLALWQYATNMPPPKKIPFRVMHSEAARDGLFRIIPVASDVYSLGVQLDQIMEFNNKLRIMFNQAEEPPDGTPRLPASELFFDPLTNSLMQGRPAPAGRYMSHLANDYQQDLGLVETEQQELLLIIRSQKHELRLIPSIWPVRGVLTSVFGWRTHPVTGQSDMHSALDISAPHGTPVVAPAAGTVVFVGWDGAYGRLIKIQHNNRISTRYAHLSAYNVEEGDEVVRGELIGYVGSSGRVTGSHLHYEVRINNKPVNPRNYILN